MKIKRGKNMNTTKIDNDKEILEDLKKRTTILNKADTVNSDITPVWYGWVCPKCGRVNAPWKDVCDCCQGIATPYTPPNTPPTHYYDPAVWPINPNPFNPYSPYKWGDEPGWWNKGPTCISNCGCSNKITDHPRASSVHLTSNIKD